MHAFQLRPGTADQTKSMALDQDWAHGFCYLARQASLWFGHDRREPVAWRPAVSLKREGDQYYVLPGTSRVHTDYFRLTKQDCLHKQTPPDERDTYLCPRYEALDRTDLSEIGILPHPVRLRIVQWLRG